MLKLNASEFSSENNRELTLSNMKKTLRSEEHISRVDYVKHN